MRCAIRLAVVLLALATGVPGQTLDELKTLWRAGDYAGVLLPMIDYRESPAGAAAAQDLDYMLTQCLCGMSEHRQRGCEYSRTLARMYGTSIRFEGNAYELANMSQNCCPPPPPALPGPGGNIGMTGKAMTYSRPWEVILAETRSTTTVTTVLDLQRGEIAFADDRILGFRTIAIERDPSGQYWHWDCKLEVEYVYDARHGKVIVGGNARGGAFETGHSYWGQGSPVQETPQGPLRKGVQKVAVAIRLLQPEAESTELSLFLYEGNPPNRTIVTQRFPFRRSFRLP